MEKKSFEEMRAIFVELVNMSLEKYDNFWVDFSFDRHKSGNSYIGIFFYNNNGDAAENYCIFDNNTSMIEDVKKILSKKNSPYPKYENKETSQFVDYENLLPEEKPF